MNIKKYKLLFGALLLTVFTTFTSCDEVDDIDIGGTVTESMSGDWFVETTLDGNAAVGFKRITTYNTAANKEEVWINDNKGIWEFKSICPVNVKNLTFQGADLASSVDGYNITVSITNGKIVKKGATTTGGNISDLISFDIEFSDDAGKIYHIEGYKRTGFAEDEH